MGKLTPESAVRRMDNLYRAWTVVRSNVNASGQAKFKAEVKRISENPISLLRRIQTRLHKRCFVFEKQHGVPKTKSSGKTRPIVVSPIGNRIVQRAILNVLQSDDAQISALLGEIGKTLRTTTSVGGIPKRGVPHGLKLVKDAIRNKATNYIRSDIRDFFTKVPKQEIVDFVCGQTGDRLFATLLSQALATELDNAEEIKHLLYLFPLDDVGVPQGSSLSAFAGNVVLRDFDKRLNGGNITTVRYIDDFVILGPSERAVRACFSSAVTILSDLGMTAYDPNEDSEKARVGRVTDDFDFLGCSVRTNGISPSRRSTKSLLADVRHTLKVGRDVIKAHTLSNRRRAEDALAQVLSRVDRKIRGWGDAFSFSDNRLPFHQIDDKVDQMLLEFNRQTSGMIRDARSDRQRRALGVALLKDTPVH